ncbi:TetR/AcrR family transcriptional regulator [Dendrosporobacter sp. 1207_IL3150]|uniref:TetR/AcrR family transcriptional regulator n=1 Tax=Dendrosporobacter sp. 1207_IL3150 TaxID=3084054 RepID=UPI002FD8853C
MKCLHMQDGKKGDLLKAALELFSEKGYDAVSVRDIAKAAGVSEAALYKHYKGKEDMALYIFSAIIEDYTNRLHGIDAMPLTSVDKLCRIAEVTYDLYEHNPAEIKLTLLSQYIFWDKVPESIKPHFVIKGVIQSGMDNGEFPRQEVYLLISIFTGIMLQPLSQYQYFYDVLPEFNDIKREICRTIRKVFS